MNWIESITEAINYIENNLNNELNMKDIAAHVYLSPFYFQKGFAMLCGFTVSEYIRNRRLSLAGIEVLNTNQKIVDIALKYGYDSPDSFTKAFTRFHKVTPSLVRKNKAMIKSFAPLKINIKLKGGYIMDYKIVKKEAFKVIGITKTFKYEEGPEEVPKFWNDFFKEEKNNIICGEYGINMDLEMNGETFEYMIASNYSDKEQISKEFTVKEIPEFTWAIFPCKGPSVKIMPEINKMIFTEWLPNCKDYEIAAGYNIEKYTDASQYPNGIEDKNYYSEIWIPIKKK